MIKRNKRTVIHSLLTSNLKMAAEPPKIAEAKCSHKRMLRPEESKPPR
jgi:hypothetical protein